MMSELLQRGQKLARDRQQKKLQAIAQQMRALFGASAVEVEEARVLVTGRGLIKRWLIDPKLRFLDGGLQ
jgi:hypothetical protein